jgi:hypothetical protein
MRDNFKPALQVSAIRTVSYFRDKVSRAAGQRSVVSWFLLHDSFIVNRNSQISRGRAKTTPPRRGRQLIKPPGRYKPSASEHIDVAKD